MPSPPPSSAAPPKLQAVAATPRQSLALRVVLLVVAALILLLLTLVLAVSLVDWNRARPWVNEKVSTASGRHFAIQGDLDAHWVWPQPLDSGWRHWMPGVLVQAEQLELGNLPTFGSFGAPAACPPCQGEGCGGRAGKHRAQGWGAIHGKGGQGQR